MPSVLTFLYFILSYIIDFLYILIIARAVMSWFPLRGTLLHIYEIIHVLTEPMLQPIRKLLSRIDVLRGMPIDFSPIVLLIILGFIDRIFLFWRP
ncbi:MAG: YggT family protein [Bacillota bacterium]|nr:YggT family protein [Bacillota bacterium]